MQIVSLTNLYEMSKPFFSGKNIISRSPVESTQSVERLKEKTRLAKNASEVKPLA